MDSTRGRILKKHSRYNFLLVKAFPLNPVGMYDQICKPLLEKIRRTIVDLGFFSFTMHAIIFLSQVFSMEI